MAATEARSTPDIVSLLLELTRVIKARRYFEPGDPRLGPLFEHAHRAWQADLRRHGAFELGLDGQRIETDEVRRGLQRLDDRFMNDRRCATDAQYVAIGE